MKICFMGTSGFALAALEALINNNYPITAIYTKASKPKNRGMKIQPSEIENLANQKNIPLETPENFKSEESKKIFKSYNFDLAIVASYGLILPKDILNMPRLGCINIHGSLLPRWRGASPIQMSLKSGDKETGITIIQMNQGLDTGDILYQKHFYINDMIAFKDLYKELSLLGGIALIESLPKILKQSVTPIKQDESLSTYAPLLKKEEGLLNFDDTAENLYNKIRGFNPFPSTYIVYKNETIKILEATPIKSQHKFKLGEVINNNQLQIACKDSILEITKLQRSGKKPISYDEFKKGFMIDKNYIFN